MRIRVEISSSNNRVAGKRERGERDFAAPSNFSEKTSDRVEAAAPSLLDATVGLIVNPRQTDVDYVFDV